MEALTTSDRLETPQLHRQFGCLGIWELHFSFSGLFLDARSDPVHQFPGVYSTGGMQNPASLANSTCSQRETTTGGFGITGNLFWIRVEKI